MAKLLTLTEWASETYSQPPSLSAMRRWAREARIYPCPELHGKECRLHPEAIYLNSHKHARNPNVHSHSVVGGNLLMEKVKYDQKA
ncbi:excisionase [Pantoea dispersa]|uniref:excisionase n=1 Tax=Pantoea dispersa TaxID=59814 RepID=UPI001266DA64|nr:excisionase [Pantoea dispersa]QFS60395.1 excisionase [Pantoea dispersa]